MNPAKKQNLAKNRPREAQRLLTAELANPGK